MIINPKEVKNLKNNINKLYMIDEILNTYPEVDFLLADGFDDAVIGVAIDFTEYKLIYSVSKCLDILEKTMNEEEAMEFFTYNVSGAYVGPKTPIWCWDTINR